MDGMFFKGAVVGGIAGTLFAAATVALAGAESGVCSTSVRTTRSTVRHCYAATPAETRNSASTISRAATAPSGYSASIRRERERPLGFGGHGLSRDRRRRRLRKNDLG